MASSGAKNSAVAVCTRSAEPRSEKEHTMGKYFSRRSLEAGAVSELQGIARFKCHGGSLHALPVDGDPGDDVEKPALAPSQG
jgi:hypothetical protein